MEKLKIILDGTLLVAGLKKNGDRRGIFFVTYNLISELSKRENISLCFYLNKKKSSAIKRYIKSEWPHLACDFFIYRPLIFFSFYQKLSKKNPFFYLTNFFIEYQKNQQKKYLDSFLEKQDCNIFFSTVNKIPGIFANTNLKKFTIVHDMIPIVMNYDPQKFGWFFRLLDSINDRDYYFTVSDYTKSDLLKYAPKINKEHVFTSYVSCDDNLSPRELPDSVRTKYNIPLGKRYMFSLFTLEPKKNLERNISTFISFIEKHKLTDFYFVIGGGAFVFDKKFTENLIKKYDSKYLVFTGYIDDKDLPLIYSGAEWFVFTSMYEGFGLPPLEAMKCGCPVIVSDSTSLPEVVGDAGIKVSWNSDEQHIAAYEKYYFDKDFRESSIKKGSIQSAKFSWKHIVDFMVEKMESVLQQDM